MQRGEIILTRKETLILRITRDQEAEAKRDMRDTTIIIREAPATVRVTLVSAKTAAVAVVL